MKDKNINHHIKLRTIIVLMIITSIVSGLTSGVIVYSSYSKWIDKEIEIAQNLGKPILAIEPWGSEKTSSVVKNAADRIVKWNTDSIVNAIRDLVK